MKILVFSDSHGNIKNMKKVIEMYKKEVDTIIHLGDYVDDIEKLKKDYSDKLFLQVAGNNDFTDIDVEKIVNINGYKIFLTHGHLYNVYFNTQSLYYKIKELGVKTCLYGHTHKPLVFKENDYLILNPGSISAPRGFKVCTFLLIQFSDTIKYKFYGIFEDEIKELK